MPIPQFVDFQCFNKKYDYAKRPLSDAEGGDRTVLFCAVVGAFPQHTKDDKDNYLFDSLSQ